MVGSGLWLFRTQKAGDPKKGLRFLTGAPRWSQIGENRPGCVILSSMDWTNKLYFGDNLRILREHVAAESVDLIYLDPPFNSSATYNVLFKEKSGEESAAQITPFENAWQWSVEAEAYRRIVTNGPLSPDKTLGRVDLKTNHREEESFLGGA